jgi:hypothetical protein
MVPKVRALKLAEQALAIDGRDHHTWRIKALLDFMNQDSDAGLAGIHPSPRDPSRSSLLASLGFVQFASRDHLGPGRTAGTAPL